MFDKATLSLGTIKVMSKVARIVGSSQQGNARRAPVGCKLKPKLKFNMPHVCIAESLPVFYLIVHPKEDPSGFYLRPCFEKWIGRGSFTLYYSVLQVPRGESRNS